VRSVPQVSFGTIGSVAGEQAPPPLQPGAQSSGQIQPPLPGDGGQPQPQFPPAQSQSPYQGQPPVGGPPAGAPGPQDGQPPFTGGQ
jgi:LemA protein